MVIIYSSNSTVSAAIIIFIVTGSVAFFRIKTWEIKTIGSFYYSGYKMPVHTRLAAIFTPQMMDFPVGVTGDPPGIYSVSSIGKDMGIYGGLWSHKSIELRGSRSCYPASQGLDSPAVIHHTPWFLPSWTKWKNFLYGPWTFLLWSLTSRLAQCMRSGWHKMDRECHWDSQPWNAFCIRGSHHFAL